MLQSPPSPPRRKRHAGKTPHKRRSSGKHKSDGGRKSICNSDGDDTNGSSVARTVRQGPGELEMSGKENLDNRATTTIVNQFDGLEDFRAKSRAHKATAAAAAAAVASPLPQPIPFQAGSTSPSSSLSLSSDDTSATSMSEIEWRTKPKTTAKKKTPSFASGSVEDDLGVLGRLEERNGTVKDHLEDNYGDDNDDDEEVSDEDFLPNSATTSECSADDPDHDHEDDGKGNDDNDEVQNWKNDEDDDEDEDFLPNDHDDFGGSLSLSGSSGPSLSQQQQRQRQQQEQEQGEPASVPLQTEMTRSSQTPSMEHTLMSELSGISSITGGTGSGAEIAVEAASAVDLPVANDIEEDAQSSQGATAANAADSLSMDLSDLTEDPSSASASLMGMQFLSPATFATQRGGGDRRSSTGTRGTTRTAGRLSVGSATAPRTPLLGAALPKTPAASDKTPNGSSSASDEGRMVTIATADRSATSRRRRVGRKSTGSHIGSSSSSSSGRRQSGASSLPSTPGFASPLRRMRPNFLSPDTAGGAGCGKASGGIVGVGGDARVEAVRRAAATATTTSSGTAPSAPVAKETDIGEVEGRLEKEGKEEKKQKEDEENSGVADNIVPISFSDDTEVKLTAKTDIDDSCGSCVGSNDNDEPFDHINDDDDLAEERVLGLHHDVSTIPEEEEQESDDNTSSNTSAGSERQELEDDSSPSEEAALYHGMRDEDNVSQAPAQQGKAKNSPSSVSSPSTPSAFDHARLNLVEANDAEEEAENVLPEVLNKMNLRPAPETKEVTTPLSSSKATGLPFGEVRVGKAPIFSPLSFYGGSTVASSPIGVQTKSVIRRTSTANNQCRSSTIQNKDDGIGVLGMIGESLEKEDMTGRDKDEFEVSSNGSNGSNEQTVVDEADVGDDGSTVRTMSPEKRSHADECSLNESSSAGSNEEKLVPGEDCKINRIEEDDTTATAEKNHTKEETFDKAASDDTIDSLNESVEETDSGDVAKSEESSCDSGSSSGNSSISSEDTSIIVLPNRRKNQEGRRRRIIASDDEEDSDDDYASFRDTSSEASGNGEDEESDSDDVLIFDQENNDDSYTLSCEESDNDIDDDVLIYESDESSIKKRRPLKKSKPQRETGTSKAANSSSISPIVKKASSKSEQLQRKIEDSNTSVDSSVVVASILSGSVDDDNSCEIIEAEIVNESIDEQSDCLSSNDEEEETDDDDSTKKSNTRPRKNDDYSKEISSLSSQFKMSATLKSSVSNESSRSLGTKKGSVRRGKWSLATQIGVGSFGVVHMGMNHRTGQIMAVKSLNLPSTDENGILTDLEREIYLMRSLSHPNIVRYIGSERDKNRHTLHIFQEWVPGGSISSLMRKFGGSFPLPVVRSYLRQIVEGLAYLHSNGIIHRDIKGGNILVNDDGICKLCDFGASRRVRSATGGESDTDSMTANDDQDNMMQSLTMRGTPYFMAVEVFEEKYGPKADIWSVGAVAFQMYTCQPPWKAMGIKNPMSLVMHLKNNEGPPDFPKSTTDENDEDKDASSNELKDLIALCFRRNPSQRPSAKKMLNHPFFDYDDDECSTIFSGESSFGMLSPKPSTRKSATECHESANIFPEKFETEKWPAWARGKEANSKADKNPFGRRN